MPIKRQTFRVLITEGLHYCCPWGFFKKHKRTGAIAATLGITDRAVRKQKAAFKAGNFACERCKNCLKGRLF